jgi:hypothetical protein
MTVSLKISALVAVLSSLLSAFVSPLFAICINLCWAFRITHCVLGFSLYKELRKLYVFFWVFPRGQIVICRRFETLCQFHLQRLGVEYWVEYWAEYWVEYWVEYSAPSLWRWNWQRVPKRRQITIWRRGNTQKNTYNIQNTAKVWNQENFISYFVSTNGDLKLWIVEMHNSCT